MARLSPYINSTIGGPNSAGAAHINAEFLQRYKILELENEELYQHLKSTTTGRLMEENKALNSVVDKLTSALKGSISAFFNVRMLVMMFNLYRRSKVACRKIVSASLDCPSLLS